MESVAADRNKKRQGCKKLFAERFVQITHIDQPTELQFFVSTNFLRMLSTEQFERTTHYHCLFSKPATNFCISLLSSSQLSWLSLCSHNDASCNAVVQSCPSNYHQYYQLCSDHKQNLGSAR